jgi:hypothetical protein
MIINQNKSFCYRITHRDNLMHLLQHGLICKDHINASSEFVQIGNNEIIDVRSLTPVAIAGYGNIGEYVPFYFTSRSTMLFNILTGYYHPFVPKREKDEIIIIRCRIADLAKLPRWFFTNGQANDYETTHFNDLKNLDKIDWDSIQNSIFTKSDGDYDRPRRYQAEFLVHSEIPIQYVESFSVYNQEMKSWVENKIMGSGLEIPVHIHKPYFFD